MKCVMFFEEFSENIEKARISEVILSYHIIGLTGRNAAGKGAVADILKKHSFVYHSLSDTLREELKKKGKKESRANLIQTGNDLRNSGGPSVLADLMIKNLISSKNHIVDSIRNPSEVDSLNRVYDNHVFNLFLVDADQEIRFDRLKNRGRTGDSSSWEEFVHQESLEEKSNDPNKQQLLATISKADFVIDNSGSLADLEKIVLKLLSSL